MKGRNAFVFVLLALVGTINAECPNACSGHGSCGQFDACTCHTGYIASDCSERVCPYGNAWADSPLGDLDASSTYTATKILESTDKYPEGVCELYGCGTQSNEGHFYQECSAKGACDRSTGVCECETGFTGSACQRNVAACLNEEGELANCNGHGHCLSIKELAEADSYDTTATHVDTTRRFSFSYDLWDAEKIYGCQCDPWYAGVDCSLRKCPVGVDPLYLSTGTAVYSTYKASFKAGADDLGGTFKLVFHDVHGATYTTTPVSCAKEDKSALVKSALIAVGGGHIISDVSVTFAPSRAESGMSYIIEFTKNPGPLKALEVDASGCTGTSVVTYVGTYQKGEYVDNFYSDVASSNVAQMVAGSDTIFTKNDVEASLSTNTIVKIEDYYGYITGLENSAIKFAWPVGVRIAGKMCSLCVTTLSGSTLTINGGAYDDDGSGSFGSVGDLILVPLEGTANYCIMELTANTIGSITVHPDHGCADFATKTQDAYLLNAYTSEYSTTSSTSVADASSVTVTELDSSGGLHLVLDTGVSAAATVAALSSGARVALYDTDITHACIFVLSADYVSSATAIYVETLAGVSCPHAAVDEDSLTLKLDVITDPKTSPDIKITDDDVVSTGQFTVTNAIPGEYMVNHTTAPTMGTLPVTERLYIDGVFYTIKSHIGDSVLLEEPYIGDTITTGASAGVRTSTVAYLVTRDTSSSTTYEYAAQCSNRGLCDRLTGSCTCFKGYAGEGCDTQNTYGG